MNRLANRHRGPSPVARPHLFPIHLPVDRRKVPVRDPATVRFVVDGGPARHPLDSGPAEGPGAGPQDGPVQSGWRSRKVPRELTGWGATFAGALMDGVASGRSPVRLRQLTVDDEQQARKAHEELGYDGFAFLSDVTDGEPWPAYLNRLDNMSRGIDLPAGWVPASSLVAEAEGQMVGCVSIRHELNASLVARDGMAGKRRYWIDCAAWGQPLPRDPSSQRPPLGSGPADGPSAGPQHGPLGSGWRSGRAPREK